MSVKEPCGLEKGKCTCLKNLRERAEGSANLPQPVYRIVTAQHDHMPHW